MTTVKINGDQVFIQYNSDFDANLSLDTELSDEQMLKWLTVVYMRLLRESSGNEKENNRKQYTSFNQLIVSPEFSNQQAALYVDQWNQYVEKKISREILFDKIQLSKNQ
jgi:hypothetical protein